MPYLCSPISIPTCNKSPSNQWTIRPSIRPFWPLPDQTRPYQIWARPILNTVFSRAVGIQTFCPSDMGLAYNWSLQTERAHKWWLCVTNARSFFFVPSFLLSSFLFSRLRMKGTLLGKSCQLFFSSKSLIDLAAYSTITWTGVNILKLKPQSV